jgi:adenine-specific DNA-methyltransferase
LTIYPNFHAHLQPFKQDLENRYQYNRAIAYWEWVFLRNFTLFSTAEKRIFVPCKERISHKNCFRFALVNASFFPTQDVTAIFKKTTTKESIEYIVSFLNTKNVFTWLKNNGIVKGDIIEFSEKPIASIPFRAINWQNNQETALHDAITSNCQQYMATKNDVFLGKINQLIAQLLAL